MGWNTLFICTIKAEGLFLAHLTQRVMCELLPSLGVVVVVVRRKLFQKSSPLKVLDQWKPNLV
jgi:hypothetical protein